jgi:two-component system sensor histidine kinase KdpD
MLLSGKRRPSLNAVYTGAASGMLGRRFRVALARSVLLLHSRRAAGAAGGVVSLAAAISLLAHVNPTTAALTLLLAVLASATFWGLAEGLAAAIAGTLCLNYFFLPPIGHWTVADPQNWVALITFVVVAVVASELSTRARRRAEMEARMEAARQSEELKSAMLDALAHAFKTPLTPLKAAATALLNDTPPGAPQREMLEIVAEETERLIAQVNEAIQLARLEAGQLEMRRAPVAVGELVDGARQRLAARLESRPCTVDLPAALPRVEADRTLAGLALRELFDNAAKHSPPGSPIAIHARQDGAAVRITVADRGPGIPEADRERIFERFYRGRAAARVPGSGIGLAVAREIAAAHGGRIDVAARAGGGSEFTFTLPATQEDAA